MKWLVKKGFSMPMNIVDLPEGKDGDVKRDICTTLEDKEVMIVISTDDDITF